MVTGLENGTTEIPLNTPVKKITIGVINKRIFGFRIPFIERQAIIARIPRGYITVRYKCNKEHAVIQPLNSGELCKWEYEEFQIPRDGITVEDLHKSIGRLWIFPNLRYIDEILPNLFERQ